MRPRMVEPQKQHLGAGRRCDFHTGFSATRRAPGVGCVLPVRSSGAFMAAWWQLVSCESVALRVPEPGRRCGSPARGRGPNAALCRQQAAHACRPLLPGGGRSRNCSVCAIEGVSSRGRLRQWPLIITVKSAARLTEREVLGAPVSVIEWGAGANARPRRRLSACSLPRRPSRLRPRWPRPATECRFGLAGIVPIGHYEPIATMKSASLLEALAKGADHSRLLLSRHERRPRRR
jgi:hypothetical protein